MNDFTIRILLTFCCYSVFSWPVAAIFPILVILNPCWKRMNPHCSMALWGTLLSMAEESYARTGCTSLGPDFFNFTDFVDRASASLPGLEGLSSLAVLATDTVESWLDSICRAGFQIGDCARHQRRIPGMGFDDKSTINRKSWDDNGGMCKEGLEFRSGFVYFDTSLVAERLNGHPTAFTSSCCLSSFWEQLHSKFPSWLDAVHVSWDGFLPQHLKAFEEQLSGFLVAGMNLAYSHEASAFSISYEAGKDIVLDESQALNVAKQCMACPVLYQLAQATSAFFTFVAWYEFYGACYLASMTPVNFIFVPSRGLNHRYILSSLLMDFRNEGETHLRAAEIGVYQGETSEALLAHLNDLSMLLVDPFQHVFGSGDKYSELYFTDPSEDSHSSRIHTDISAVLPTCTQLCRSCSKLG